VSPKEGGFLRELTQQPSLNLLPLAEYRDADVIVNPPEDLTLEELQEYLRAGGRILYYGKQPPAEISPFEESEEGRGGVAWVNPHAGKFAEINWSGHLGGTGWKKVKKGANVLAVLEDGTPYFVYHAVEDGAVAYLGKKSDIWFHDEMLALAIEYFAQCPLGFSLEFSAPDVVEMGPHMDVSIHLSKRAPQALHTWLWVEWLLFYDDPFIGKEMALPSPGRYKFHRAFEGPPYYRHSATTSWLAQGKLVIAASLSSGDEKHLLASAVKVIEVRGRAPLKLSTKRRVIRQNDPMHIKIESQPGPNKTAYTVVDPFDQKIVEGQVETDQQGLAEISMPCGKWVTGRYRIEVVLTDEQGGPLNRKWLVFYVAPDAPFEPPHWLGRWDVYFRKRGWRERLYNYRELGITFGSWTDWGSWWPQPGEWEEAEEILDWAAAAGFKINFWGINDKSAPPKKLLAHFGIEETDDFHCLSENGKRESGKCLTEPQMTQAFTKYFDELSRSELLSHPAFGFFTMSDEGGRFLKCWCDRCLGEYEKWMRSRGVSLEKLGVKTWREAYEPRTRTNMQYLCGEMRRWYKTMIDVLHERTPQLLTTTNHGGMAFTFGRYQYPWIVDDIFQMMEADSYPWWIVDDTDSIMDRTCFTTAILRSAGHFERPINLIVNAQEVHGGKDVKRPPRMLPNDLLEQIYGAVIEGARSVDFYAETFHHRWHVSFDEWKKYPGLTDMPDDRYAESLQRPISEMQSVIREASKTLDMLDPILRMPNRRADIAIVKPIIEEVWFPRWMKPFKEATGGSPVDYLGEDLQGIEHYRTVLLPENIAKSGLPDESWKKLRQWVERGGLLIASQLSGQHALHLFGAEVTAEPMSEGSVVLWRTPFAPKKLKLPPQANPRPVNPVTAVIAARHADGRAAVTSLRLGDGRTHLFGFDLADSRDAAAVLLEIMSVNRRPPLVRTNQPHVDLSVKEVDGTYHILALYYREPVTWSPEKDTFYPDPLETTIILNLVGDFDAYDVFSSTKIPLKGDEGRQLLKVSLPLSRLRAYALIPRGPDELTISIPKGCKAGMRIPYQINSAATKLIHIEFINPRGQVDSRLSHYALTNRQYLLDSCDNDLPGTWTLRTTDLQTSICTEESFNPTLSFRLEPQLQPAARRQSHPSPTKTGALDNTCGRLSQRVQDGLSTGLIGGDRRRGTMAEDEFSQEAEAVGEVDDEEEDGEDGEEFPSLVGGNSGGEEERERDVQPQNRDVGNPHPADEEGEHKAEKEEDDKSGGDDVLDAEFVGMLFERHGSAAPVPEILLEDGANGMSGIVKELDFRRHEDFVPCLRDPPVQLVVVGKNHVLIGAADFVEYLFAVCTELNGVGELRLGGVTVGGTADSERR